MREYLSAFDISPNIKKAGTIANQVLVDQNQQNMSQAASNLPCKTNKLIAGCNRVTIARQLLKTS